MEPVQAARLSRRARFRQMDERRVVTVLQMDVSVRRSFVTKVPWMSIFEVGRGDG